jgi:hypothetical protein
MMATINILLLAIGWLLISCGIARVLGGACEIGASPAERTIDVTIVIAQLRLTDEDDWLGLVLEREASSPVACFPAFFPRLSVQGGLAAPATRIPGVSTLQTAAQDLAAPDISLTPIG